MKLLALLLAVPVLLLLAVLAAGAVASLVITRTVEAAHPPGGPFVAVPGGRLATLQDGPADAATTVVLLHGASANAADPMEGVGHRLAAQGFRVIAFDRPGFGWSDRLGGAEAAAPAFQARAVAQALAAMGVGRAVVLGHSWGGALALRLALDHPERVSGLVLVAPVAMPLPMPALPWYWRLALQPPVAWILSRTMGPPLARHFLPGAAAHAFRPQAEPPDFQARARAALVLRPATLLANVQDLAGLPRALAEQSPRYGTLALPTAIVTGDADPLVREPVQAAPLAAAIPGARLVRLPGIGHMVPWVATDALAAAVAEVAEVAAAARRPCPTC